ncbi:MAG: PUA domain-containing protein [Candidatus Hadarchaeales archaeon]
MPRSVPTEKEVQRLRAVADYQFGQGAGEALFRGELQLVRGRGGKIRQVWSGGVPICSIRASDGFIVLNREGAVRLHSAIRFPRLRVVVAEEAVPFVGRGRDVFAKHVLEADPEIRPAEEVLVVDQRDRLLATGRAVLNGEEMVDFDTGVAVKVRRATIKY